MAVAFEKRDWSRRVEEVVFVYELIDLEANFKRELRKASKAGIGEYDHCNWN